MNFQIIGYYKNYPILTFISPIVPKIGEKVFSPHKGLFKVIDIEYHISDDCDKFENKIMWIELLLVDEGECLI